jgi:hypothetical protein
MLACLWAKESEGGRREDSAVRRPAPFEAEAGEEWESRVRCRVEEKMGQREGSRGSATWTGMTRTRRLRIALTAASGAGLAGAAGALRTGEGGGAQWAATGCGRDEGERAVRW